MTGQTLTSTFRKHLTSKYNQLIDLQAKRGKSLLWLIDEFCGEIAILLGKSLGGKESKPAVLSSERVAWIWGQYRGTAISGERELHDYFVADWIDSGDRKLHDYLLEFYWRCYGISQSLGELFHRRTISYFDENKTPGTSSVSIAWHSLRVRLESVDRFEFSEEDVDCTKGRSLFQGTHLHCDISVPKQWLEDLLPEDLFIELREQLKEESQKVKTRRTNHNKRRDAIDSLLEGKRFRTRMERRTNLFVAQMLANADPLEKESEEFDGMRQFLFRDEMSHEGKLNVLAKALQMFALYWRWTEQKQVDLLVVHPIPSADEMLAMPRVGLAFALVRNPKATRVSRLKEASEIVDFIDCALVQPQYEVMDDSGKVIEDPHASLKALGRSWAGTELEIPIEQELAFLSPDSATHLIEAVISSLHGSSVDAAQVLSRVLPVIRKLADLIPTFVHEGHRFGVTVLVGLPYHEQLLGRQLASLEQVKNQLDAEPGSENEVELLKPLIQSCYSVLDGHEIVLFGHLSPHPQGYVKWSSLLQLSEPARGITRTPVSSDAARFEALTEGFGNLFVLTVSQSGKLRVFNHGKVLLECNNGHWKQGASTEELRKKLEQRIISFFTQNGTSFDTQADKDQFRMLASLLQRVSEAPGAGTLLILTTDMDELNNNILEIAAPPEELYNRPLGDLLEDPNDIVFRLATMDGATVIVMPIGKQKGNLSKARIHPRRIVAERFELAKFKERWVWPEWRECLSFGSKRSAALALAMQRKIVGTPCLCIVVSADGPIYFMPGEQHPVQSA